MPYFLRLATRSAWNGAEAPTEEQRERARKNLALREGEEGLSLWEIASAQDRELVLAAIACDRQRVENIDYIEIDESAIKALGTVVPTAGQTPVSRANALHRELKWPQEKIDALVERELAARTKGVRATRAEVRKFVCDLRDTELNEGVRGWQAQEKKKQRQLEEENAKKAKGEGSTGNK